MSDPEAVSLRRGTNSREFTFGRGEWLINGSQELIFAQYQVAKDSSGAHRAAGDAALVPDSLVKIGVSGAEIVKLSSERPLDRFYGAGGGDAVVTRPRRRSAARTRGIP
jgi:hypothetical protein